MGLLDSLAFDPQSYAGSSGILGRLLGEIQPDARGYAGGTPWGDAPPSMAQASLQERAVPPSPTAPAGAAPSPDLGDIIGGIGSHLGAGLLGMLNSGSPAGALGALLQGLFTGKRADPLGMALDQQNAMFSYLVKQGTPPDQAAIIAQNPKAQELFISQMVAPKTTFGPIGEGPLGKQYGFINTTSGEVKPYSQGGASGGIPVGLEGPPLMDWLKKNDPATAAGVQGLIDGDISAGRNLQKLLPIAKLVDPTMAQFDYNTRMRTRMDFTSGKSAKELKAANTAIGHANDLYNLVDQLGNSSFLPAIVNPAAQVIKGQTSESFQGVRGHYDSKAEALATELSKAFNGGQTSDSDRQHWRDVLDKAKSPVELKAAISSAMTQLLKRFDTNAESYNKGMGTNKQPLDFVDTGNKAIFEALMGGTASASPAPGAASPAPPATARTVQEGATATNPKTGQRLIYHGGQWVPLQ